MKLKDNGDDNDFPDRLAIKSEWLNTTCNHALYALTDVFSQYFAPPTQRPARPALVVLPAGQVGYLLPGDPHPKQRVRVQCLLNVFSSTTTRPCSIIT